MHNETEMVTAMEKTSKRYTIEELKQLKARYGLTYEDIRQNCTLSISTIQKAFGGINKHPRHSTLEELSSAMDRLVPDHANVSYDFLSTDAAYVREQSSFYSRGSSALDNSSGRSFNQEIFTQSGYTYDDYMKLDLPDGMRVELIDGVIYEMSAPTLTHQTISFYFARTFDDFIRKNKGKCKVYISPVDVRLEFATTDMTVVQPDVLVICDRSKDEDKKTVKGAPDYILEVLSPSSRKIDTNLKLRKYRETGVREYWIVDYDSGVVIKNVFTDGEWTKIYTTSDVVPVEIYDGKLEIDFNDLRKYVES